MAVLLLLCFLSTNSYGQSRKNLEQQRKQLLKEIEQTNKQLAETKKNKQATLDQFISLQNKIRKRQRLIETINQEVAYADSSISRTEDVIVALNKDIDQLKKEYLAILKTAYRVKLNNSFVLFLFSSQDLNDAFRRWRYIKQYNDYRKRQARLIRETQFALESKADQLKVGKAEKEELLTSIKQQEELLNTELSDKDKLLKNLKQNESKLASNLDRQQKEHDALNAAIEKIIKAEVEKAKRAARASVAISNDGDNSSAPAAALASNLSGSFSAQKGKLPWPVKGGTISKNFGTQPHPTIKSIKITNNGIDIKVSKDTRVYSIYNGTVAGKQYIPGYKYTVIIQHGSFYTVYSNLETTYVERGDNIDANQLIGKIDQNKKEIHFEIWKEKKRLNPVNWVASK